MSSAIEAQLVIRVTLDTRDREGCRDQREIKGNLDFKDLKECKGQKVSREFGAQKVELDLRGLLVLKAKEVSLDRWVIRELPVH